MRQNMRWLEDKWARQGRAHTTLADMVGHAAPLSSDQIAELAAHGGFGGEGAAGTEPAEPASHASHASPPLGDLRQMPGLSAEQLRLLEEGVHPSRIPGLEGGVDIELDEQQLERLRSERERGRGPGPKTEL